MRLGHYMWYVVTQDTRFQGACGHSQSHSLNSVGTHKWGRCWRDMCFESGFHLGSICSLDHGSDQDNIQSKFQAVVLSFSNKLGYLDLDRLLIIIIFPCSIHLQSLYIWSFQRYIYNPVTLPSTYFYTVVLFSFVCGQKHWSIFDNWYMFVSKQ